MEILNVIGGAFFLVFVWWKAEKQKREENPKYAKKHTWKQFILTKWDDAIYSIGCGVLLGIYREELVYIMIYWRGWDFQETWNLYYDLEMLILFGYGFFGTLIVKGLILAGQGAIKLTLGLVEKLSK